MSRRQRKKPNRPSSRLSDHFKKEDFICPMADRDEFKLSLGLVGALEKLRSQIQDKITILKGFESVASMNQNRSIRKNYHNMGLAADIRIENHSLSQVYELVIQVEEIKGIGINLSGNHIHIDTRKSPDRKEWVILNNEFIDITDENRAQYLQKAAQSTQS